MNILYDKEKKKEYHSVKRLILEKNYDLSSYRKISEFEFDFIGSSDFFSDHLSTLGNPLSFCIVPSSDADPVFVLGNDSLKTIQTQYLSILNNPSNINIMDPKVGLSIDNEIIVIFSTINLEWFVIGNRYYDKLTIYRKRNWYPGGYGSNQKQELVPWGILLESKA